MSWSDQWVHIEADSLLTGGIPFYERTAMNPTGSKASSRAPIGSWMVGGQPDGGPVMVQRLPVEVERIGSLPIYRDETNSLFFVNGYPENYATLGEAEFAARTILGITPETPAAGVDWTTAAKVGAGAAFVIWLFSRK